MFRSNETTSIVLAIASMSLVAKLFVLVIAVLAGANMYAMQVAAEARATQKKFERLDYLQCLYVGCFSGLVFFGLAVVLFDEWTAGWVAAAIGASLGLTGVTSLGGAILNSLSTIAKRRL